MKNHHSPLRRGARDGGTGRVGRRTSIRDLHANPCCCNGAACLLTRRIYFFSTCRRIGCPSMGS